MTFPQQIKTHSIAIDWSANPFIIIIMCERENPLCTHPKCIGKVTNGSVHYKKIKFRCQSLTVTFWILSLDTSIKLLKPIFRWVCLEIFVWSTQKKYSNTWIILLNLKESKCLKYVRMIDIQYLHKIYWNISYAYYKKPK